MPAHGFFRAFRVMVPNGCKNGFMLFLNLRMMARPVERHEPEPKRAIMQFGQCVCEHEVFGGECQNIVEFAIQQHQLLAVAHVDPLLGARQNVRQMGNFITFGALGSKAHTMRLVEQAHFDDLHDFVEADGFHDDAFARHHIEHAFQHQSVDGLVHGRATNAQHGGNISFVDIFTRPEGTGDDAMFDRFISRVTQGLRLASRIPARVADWLALCRDFWLVHPRTGSCVRL